MKATLCAVLRIVALAAPSVAGALTCNGVLSYDEGIFSARFRCRFAGQQVRRVRATCADGEVGCDADGACNGACAFAVCSDSTCSDTFPVVVSLRRDGTAKGRSVFRAGNTKMILRCLPPRGECGPGNTVTTTSTTSTTLPARPCTATLSGAVDATVGCTASLRLGGLFLPVLVIDLDGEGVDGKAALLLTAARAGTYRLGDGVILAIVGFTEPDLPSFQATRTTAEESAEVVLESVAPRNAGRFDAHGRFDASLPSVSSGEALRLEVQF
jgi:hypothetical protein